MPDKNGPRKSLLKKIPWIRFLLAHRHLFDLLPPKGRPQSGVTSRATAIFVGKHLKFFQIRIDRQFLSQDFRHLGCHRFGQCRI